MVNLDSRAGKDQFVSFCQKHTVWCENLSTVEFVKHIATLCGWDGTKTPKNRAFLSDLKDLLTQWGDIPFEDVKRRTTLFNARAIGYDFSTDDVIVFIHCREPQEIDKFVKEMGAKTLLIRRESIETTNQSNHADAEVFNYDYDYCVQNNGSLEELEQKAIEFLDMLGIPRKLIK